MKLILQRMLALAAVAFVARHRPRVVAIAGSVGKTSAKDAIFCVVGSQLRARKADDSYNNEIGVPLTIIGEKAQGKNLLGWAMLFVRVIGRLIGVRDYPKVLVLEFGEQKPGGIGYLMRLVRPDIGVLTTVDKVHLEFFKSLDAIERELTEVVRGLGPSGTAVLNADDERIAKYSDQLKVKTVTYGLGASADICAEQVAVIRRDSILGLHIRVRYRESSVPLFLPEVVSHHQAYAALAACAVGVSMGMNLVDVGAALESYRPPRGRMVLIEGLQGSMIIDDTYNASPVSVIAALSIFKDVLDIRGKKIAVFGDMLELGDFADEGHEQVGSAAHACGVTELVTVGRLAKNIVSGARAAGMSAESTHAFDDQQSAVAFLKKIAAEGDYILIKGSQGARMERVVQQMMDKPHEAQKLLVRQSRSWRTDSV